MTIWHDAGEGNTESNQIERSVETDQKDGENYAKNTRKKAGAGEARAGRIYSINITFSQRRSYEHSKVRHGDKSNMRGSFHCIILIQHLRDGLTWVFCDRSLRFAAFAGLFPSEKTSLDKI